MFADLEEVMDIANDLVKYVFRRILVDCLEEIKFFTKYYDNDLFDRLMNVVKSDFINLDYSEAVKILQNSGVEFEFPIYWGCDLKNEHVRYLTDKEFKKPVYIINYPKDLKPFYIKANKNGYAMVLY